MTYAYVIAGTHPWTLEVLTRMRAGVPGDWRHVITPGELESAIVEAPRRVFVLHWHWLIPARLWQAMPLVNVHAAPLPWGRGGHPIENQLLRGRTETVLTAHQVVAEIDAGPIYARSGPVPLTGRTKADILAGFVAPCVALLTHIIRDDPQPVPQEGEVVIFKRLSAEDYEAFWATRQKETTP